MPLQVSHTFREILYYDITYRFYAGCLNYMEVNLQLVWTSLGAPSLGRGRGLFGPEHIAHCLLPYRSWKIFICGFVVVAGFIFSEKIWRVRVTYFVFVVVLCCYFLLYFSLEAPPIRRSDETHTHKHSRTQFATTIPQIQIPIAGTVSGPGIASCHRHSLLLLLFWV